MVHDGQMGVKCLFVRTPCLKASLTEFEGNFGTGIGTAKGVSQGYVVADLFYTRIVTRAPRRRWSMELIIFPQSQ